MCARPWTRVYTFCGWREALANIPAAEVFFQQTWAHGFSEGNSGHGAGIKALRLSTVYSFDARIGSVKLVTVSSLSFDLNLDSP